MSDTTVTADNSLPEKIDFIHQSHYGNNSFMWSVLAIMIGVVVFIIASVAILFALGIIGTALPTDDMPDGFEDHLLLLASFLAFYPAFWVAQTKIHKRKWLDLITSAPTFRWSVLRNAAFLSGGAMIILALYEWFSGGATWVYDSNSYWSFLIVTLILVPFQAASEEILLRGYANQFFVRYLKSPWVVYVITSMIFASLHFANPEADSGYFYQYALLIFVAGFTACIVTHYTGGLEAAIGMHIFNNLVVFTVAGYDIPGEPTTTLLSLGEIQFSWFDTIIAVLFEFVVAFIVIWYLKRQQSRTILSANTINITP